MPYNGAMVDIETPLREAWTRVRPRLEAEPEELRRRLARGAQATLSKPPRAWCLAVRANDTRIDDGLPQPWDALDRKRDRDKYPPGYWQNKPAPQRHEVRLDSDFVRRLCAPVRIDPP